ncbi:3'-5' exonuclease [Flavisolibacter nicotianae]|uniref:3'-5' exonuclease n=1 Tax=Flavisolibacter nicotianae TaxID=2364882 RepID=UPI000EAD64EA|nr:3'-5' exonuclease [Flavisolibacter nicotianae]
MEPTFYIQKPELSFLELSKPIVFFDLETTGVDTVNDRIVELCAVRVNPDGTQQEVHLLLNPTISIPVAASAVHGITDEMVVDKPTFEEKVDELAQLFTGCDLGGYNIKKFDVPVLMQEFLRFKKHPIKYSEVKLVDAMAIYHHKEKRDLSAAVKFYCQREHDGAHSAKADVLATIDILKRQLLMYDDLKPNTSFLHDYVGIGNLVDFSGRFIRDDAGRIVFNFGKHYGKEACTERDYLKWMMDSDFNADTKQVATRIYWNCIWEDQIKAWLSTNKLTQSYEMISALYTTVKFEEAVFPFAILREGAKLKVSYLVEPPATYTFVHQDAVDILLGILDSRLSGENK